MHSRDETRIWEHLLHVPYLLLYGLVKYIPSPLGAALRWPVLKLFGLRGGFGIVHEGVTVLYPWRVTVGRGWSMNEGVYIVPGARVDIGDNVRLAARVSLIATNHVFDRPDVPIKRQGYVNAPVRIEDDVWIGINSVVLAGVCIGRGSVVGAASVVTRSVAALSVVAGNPARVMGHRNGDATARDTTESVGRGPG